MPNKELLLRYANLKLQISKYEKEVEMLKDLVLEEVLGLRGDNDQVALTELPGCSFTIKELKTWTYTPIVKELETRFKDRKTLEQQNGDATFVKKDSLIFNPPKE